MAAARPTHGAVAVVRDRSAVSADSGHPPASPRARSEFVRVAGNSTLAAFQVLLCLASSRAPPQDEHRPYPTSRDDDAFTTSPNVLDLMHGVNFETIRSLAGPPRQARHVFQSISRHTRLPRPQYQAYANKTNARAAVARETRRSPDCQRYRDGSSVRRHEDNGTCLRHVLYGDVVKRGASGHRCWA